MDTGGFKLTTLFIVMIVVPATFLSFLSLGAIRRERSAVERRALQSLEKEMAALTHAITNRLGEPVAALRRALAKEAPQDDLELMRVLRSAAGSTRWLTEAILLRAEGSDRHETRPISSERVLSLGAYDALFERAEGLETLAEAPVAALKVYDEIGRAHLDDPTVQVEILSARGRLYRRIFPEGHSRVGAVRSYEAYSLLIQRYPLTPDRTGAIPALGARLEVAAFWRLEESPRELERVLEDLVRFTALHEAALGQATASFYRREALAALRESNPARAERAIGDVGRIAADRVASRSLRAALEGSTVLAELRAHLERITAHMPSAAADVDTAAAYFMEDPATSDGRLVVMALPVPEVIGGEPRALAVVRVETSRLWRDVLHPAVATAAYSEHGVIELVSLPRPQGAGPGEGSPDPRAGGVLRGRLPPPVTEVYEITAQRVEERSHDPVDLIGTQIRVWAPALAMLGLAIGAIVMTGAIRREMREAQLKSDFVTTVTHELKTPLTSIGMFAETLLLGRVESAEEQRECLEVIAKETERLTRLIERVLTFSKIEARTKRFQFRLVPLKDLVHSAVALFKTQMRGGTPFVVELSAFQEIPDILCDRVAIEEVLLNLLHNAYKYGNRPRRGSRSGDEVPEPPAIPIQVTVTKRRRWAEIAVRDWGIGIRRRDQRRIFRKFYRADNALTREVEGSGIGLTLARSIALAHRGDITVKSRPGQGSVFSLWLPR